MSSSGGTGGTKAIIAAFLANLGIAIAKFLGFLFTGSSSMLAESIHSVADTGNQGLLLLGGKRAQREATPEHPFGKVTHPHEIESAPVAIVILLLAIVAEGLSFRTALRESAGERHGRSLFTYIRRSKSPEFPVVILEDFAALTGLALALAALGTALVTGNARWDGVGTLCIGVLLVVVAVVLAVEMKSLLIGESASAEVQRHITAAIEGDDHVNRVIHLRTEHLGPDELLVGVKVAFAPTLDVATLAGAIDRVEAAVRDKVPSVRLLYVEPDLDRSAAGAAEATARNPTR